MRNFLIKFFSLMFVSFCVTADDVVKVYDKGLDGNMRMYSIACPNGKKTTSTQKFGELKDIKPSDVTENTFEPEEPEERWGQGQGRQARQAEPRQGQGRQCLVQIEPGGRLL